MGATVWRGELSAGKVLEDLKLTIQVSCLFFLLFFFLLHVPSLLDEMISTYYDNIFTHTHTCMQTMQII